MKIRFLKNHSGYMKDSTAELPEGLSNYLISCIVAVDDSIEVEEKKVPQPKKEKKVIEPKLEKK